MLILGFHAISCEQYSIFLPGNKSTGLLISGALLSVLTHYVIKPCARGRRLSSKPQISFAYKIILFPLSAIQCREDRASGYDACNKEKFSVQRFYNAKQIFAYARYKDEVPAFCDIIFTFSISSFVRFKQAVFSFPSIITYPAYFFRGRLKSWSVTCLPVSCPFGGIWHIDPASSAPLSFAFQAAANTGSNIHHCPLLCWTEGCQFFHIYFERELPSMQFAYLQVGAGEWTASVCDQSLQQTT